MLMIEEINCGFVSDSIRVVMSDMDEEVVVDKNIYTTFRETMNDEELFRFLTVG